MIGRLDPLGVLALGVVIAVWQLAASGWLVWAVVVAVVAGLLVAGLVVARLVIRLVIAVREAEAKLEAAEIVRGVTYR